MFSLNSILYFLEFIPYGKEIKASICGRHFYDNQIYRDEEEYEKYNSQDLEKGVIEEQPTTPPNVSYY